MAKFAHIIVSLATGAAFLFPLSFMPDAREKCSDPSWQFVTHGPDGSTVVDTRTPSIKDKFCGVVNYVR